METKITIRDNPQNFVDFVNNYGTVNQADFVPQTIQRYRGRHQLLHVCDGGMIVFSIDVIEPERLEVTATTVWEIDAYFGALVRAIRWKWTAESELNELERFYLRAVRERPTERGKLEDYCHRVGVTDQTLRNWERKFQAMGIETKQT